MFQKIRLFFRYTMAWIIVIGCVSLIGFVLYPLLSEKYQSMALPNNVRYTGGYTIKRWYPLEISRNTEILSGEVLIPRGETSKIDILQDTVEKNVGEKSSHFFGEFKNAFSTNTSKKTVVYRQDETGVYRGK